MCPRNLSRNLSFVSVALVPGAQFSKHIIIDEIVVTATYSITYVTSPDNQTWSAPQQQSVKVSYSFPYGTSKSLWIGDTDNIAREVMACATEVLTKSDGWLNAIKEFRRQNPTWR